MLEIFSYRTGNVGWMQMSVASCLEGRRWWWRTSPAGNLMVMKQIRPGWRWLSLRTWPSTGREVWATSADQRERSNRSKKTDPANQRGREKQFQQNQCQCKTRRAICSSKLRFVISANMCAGRPRPPRTFVCTSVSFLLKMPRRPLAQALSATEATRWQRAVYTTGLSINRRGIGSEDPIKPRRQLWSPGLRNKSTTVLLLFVCLWDSVRSGKYRFTSAKTF